VHISAQDQFRKIIDICHFQTAPLSILRNAWNFVSSPKGFLVLWNLS